MYCLHKRRTCKCLKSVAYSVALDMYRNYIKTKAAKRNNIQWNFYNTSLRHNEKMEVIDINGKNYNIKINMEKINVVKRENEKINNFANVVCCDSHNSTFPACFVRTKPTLLPYWTAGGNICFFLFQQKEGDRPCERCTNIG